MAQSSRKPSVDIFVDPHPGGEEYGWVISSLIYRSDDEEPSSGPNSEHDDKKSAVAYAKKLKLALSGPPDRLARVAILVDGNLLRG